MLRLAGTIYRHIMPRSLRAKLNLGHKVRRSAAPLWIRLHLPLKKRLKKIRFIVELAAHCNLNCAGCNHFSPLAEPELLSLDEFRRDMERLGDVFSHECTHLTLAGGEPLLHPDIISCMKIARRNFSEGKIEIITNGILLAQKEDAFWQACHDNEIFITVTHYPVKINEEGIVSLAQKFGVDVDFMGWEPGDMGLNAWKDHFFCVPIDISGRHDSAKNFAVCGVANGCIMLSHGRLFTCPTAATIERFAKKFGKDISVSEADYVDIYKADKETILRKLAEPIPMCRYCDLDGQRNFEWHVSKRDISEWI